MILRRSASLRAAASAARLLAAGVDVDSLGSGERVRVTYGLKASRLCDRPFAIFVGDDIVFSGTYPARLSSRAGGARSRPGLTNRRGDRPTVVVDKPFHSHHSSVATCALKAISDGRRRRADDVRVESMPVHTIRCSDEAARLGARLKCENNANDNSKRWITRLVCR